MLRFSAPLSLAAALLVSACSSTSFISAWRSPTAKPLQLKGEKVAAVVLVKNMVSRKAGEERLAQEITNRGAQGVPLYRILPDAAAGEEAQVRAALEQAKFKAVVVMHPVATHNEVRVTAEPDYDHYWGGYYGYGWGSTWGGTRYETHTDTVVTVETRVYSLEQNELVWAGRSETTNPKNVDEFVVELAAAVADELKAAQVIE
jgi:hypothetical protein